MSISLYLNMNINHLYKLSLIPEWYHPALQPSHLLISWSITRSFPCPLFHWQDSTEQRDLFHINDLNKHCIIKSSRYISNRFQLISYQLFNANYANEWVNTWVVVVMFLLHMYSSQCSMQTRHAEKNGNNFHSFQAVNVIDCLIAPSGCFQIKTWKTQNMR